MKYFQLFETFDFIKKKQIKPEKRDPQHNSCSIGFSEKDGKWYGWSHRAYYGFKVGSKVKLGDSGYMPSNKEEFLKSLEKWYKPDHKDAEFEHTKTGVKVTYTIRGEKESHVEPYPSKWGKGEWTAKTLADAKQMAIDFAESVS